MIERDHQSAAPLASPWWLAPTTLFAMVVGLTMLAAASQSDHAFQLYGTPKFIRSTHIVLAGLAILAFVVGGRWAAVTAREGPGNVDAALPLVERWFWIATGLTLFGYAVWLLVGLRNGFTLGTLREFLTTDDPLLAEEIRGEIFTNLKGITTCTQFGVAAVPLGVLLYFRGIRRVVWPLAALFGLAALRALLFSERLALIELALPAAIIVLRLQSAWGRWRPLLDRTVKLAPALGIAALFVFFGAFEYFRSWRYYQDKFDSYAQFTVWRITGYYTTAHNNGAMALTTQPLYPLPYSTLRSLWSIPGLEKTPLGYKQITGVDPNVRHESMLMRYGTPELNNEGGLFQPALDFGAAGLLLFWFASGFVAGRLHAGYLRASLMGLTLYPLVALAILETPRFLYLCYPRSLPAILTLLLVTWLARQAQPQIALRPTMAVVAG